VRCKCSYSESKQSYTRHVWVSCKRIGLCEVVHGRHEHTTSSNCTVPNLNGYSYVGDCAISRVEVRVRERVLPENTGGSVCQAIGPALQSTYFDLYAEDEHRKLYN